MSATEELRRMLDERGVEWTYGDGTVSYASGGHWCHAWAYDDGAVCVSMGYFTPKQAIEATLGRGTCASCYYYQTAYDDHSRPAGMACFAEHLRASVGGLDVEEEAEAWAQVGPDDYCSKWTAKNFRAKVAGKGEGLDACGQI